MKKLLKFAFIGLFLMTVNQSCTDLEEELFSEIRTEDFYQSDEEFISALGAAYTSLYFYMNHNTYLSAQEVSSDEIMIPQRGADWFDGGVWLRCHRHEFTPDEGYLNNMWNNLYGGINTCNRLIFQFNALPESAGAAPFIAELRTLRALFYYYLLDTFGNVPIIDKFDVDPGFQPETRPRAEVYNFVESELTAAAQNLSKSVDGSTYARMQFYVAQAILSKLYLNAEVYTGQPQWQKAIDAADEVINSGNYALENDYFVNFNTNNSSSTENIFVIPYDEVFAGGFNLAQMTLHYLSQQTFRLTAQPWNGYCTISEFYNSYEDEDGRKGVYGDATVRGNFIAGPQFAADGTPLIDEAANDPDGPPLVFEPDVNEHFPNAHRQAGARVGKYQFGAGSTPNLNNDAVVFRYADILLTKAEAMWRMNPGSEEALEMVNMIRRRAGGIDEFDSLDADNLLAERGREMFYEGVRRQDLIRFGRFASGRWDFKDPADEKFNLFPIPRPQLDVNPNLDQNPGY